MMAYSRQQHIEPEAMNINKIIRVLSVLLRRAIEERIELVLELEETLDIINGDRTAIDKILMNLCNNAIDAMEQGGRLTIRTKNIAIDEANKDSEVKSGNYVLLEVEDIGVGIPQEYIEKIFEPFFTTKEVGRGTGRGLSMVIGLVKHHDGYIYCDSTVNQGTKFELLLPVLLATAEPQKKTLPIKYSRRPNETKILIVEDEVDLLKRLKTMLEQGGFIVLTATNGLQALDIYKTMRILLIWLFPTLLCRL